MKPTPIQKELGSVAEVTSGQSAPQDKTAFSDTGRPFIRAGSLESLLNGQPEDSLEHIPDDKAKQFRMRLFPPDTIVFAKSGMSAKIGRVYRLKTPCYVVSHLAAIIPKENLDPGYLQRWLEKNPPSRLIPNDAYPSIRLSAISSLKIPLPPLDEQRRIADILDKADEVRSKRQEAIRLTEELLRSAFLDMFGDPVTNPKGWRRDEIGSLLKLKSGQFLPAKTMLPGPYPVYGGNGVNGHHSEYLFEKSTIVIGRVGVYCGAIHRAPAQSWVTDNALYIAEKTDELLDDYLEWALRFANLNQYASQAAQPLLSGSRIYPVKINVPPIELQYSFSNFLNRQKKFAVNLGDTFRSTDDLFNSLVQRAFKGEL